MQTQESWEIFELLKIGLPQIKRALGARWPGLANQIQNQAESFRRVQAQAAGVDETTGAELNPILYRTANQLLFILLKNEIAQQIIEQTNMSFERSPNPPIHSITTLSTVANRFYLLCQKIDEAIEYGDIEAFLRQAEATNQANPNMPSQKIERKTNQEK